MDSLVTALHRWADRWETAEAAATADITEGA